MFHVFTLNTVFLTKQHDVESALWVFNFIVEFEIEEEETKSWQSAIFQY